MKGRTIVTIIAGVLACGLPLWPIPYNQVSLPGNPSVKIWLGLGAMAGALGGWLLEPKLRRPILAVTLGYMLAVCGRIEVETSRDPTTHNLAPFEVIIAAFYGFIAACIGVAVAWLVRGFTKRASTEKA
ncbi:MAG: hypothetical protein ACREPM_03315 [Gemmatimonadaceae bacterium]